MEKNTGLMELMTTFEGVKPKLSTREFANLTEDIRQHGVLTPILVYKGKIIDGHNRYRICKEYNIPFETKEMNFCSDSEAIVWIIKEQVGKRNLTPFQRCEMVLKYEPEIRADIEKRRKAAISYFRRTGEVMEAGSDTGTILGDMVGVSRNSINRVKKILAMADEETKELARAGKISIYYAYMSLTSKPTAAAQVTQNADNDANDGSGDSSDSDNCEASKLLTSLKAEEIKTAEVKQGIKDLIEKVSDGSASPKAIVEKLEALLNTLEA